MWLHSWRNTTPVTPSPRRSFPWARAIVAIVTISVLAYVFVPPLFSIRADALVQGDLVPVAPLYRARVDRLLVGCDDHVRAGQRVAVVSNFLVQADYQRQFLQSSAQEQLSTIDLAQQVAAARVNAEAMHEKYVAAQLDADRLRQTFASYDAAYRQGAVARVEWQDTLSAWQTAQALADAGRNAWGRARQEVERISADRDQQAQSARAISMQAAGLADRTSNEPLLAPVDGYVVDCTDRPQNVIEASTPLFRIFSPSRAYVLAYVNPDAVKQIHVGQAVNVGVAGLSKPIEGRVQAIYPDLAKLPTQLTRFFWQHPQWSEYRPVRVSLGALSAADREELYYGAQARITIALRPYPNLTTTLGLLKE